MTQVATSGQGPPLADPLAVALGYKNWNYGPQFSLAGVAPGTQKIFALGLWLPGATVCTGAVIDVNVAGAGTAPTGFFLGLADTGNIRAQTANLAADAGLTTTGTKQYAFSATYTTPAAGLYYVLVLKNGAFATTDISLGQAGTVQSAVALAGFGVLYGNIGTGQTVLPSNGTAISVVADARAFRVGIY